MNLAIQEEIHHLWDELADFEDGQSEQAARHLMMRLCDMLNVSNATWGGAIRVSGESGNDPLLGWRVAAMHQLHAPSSTSENSHFKEILELWDKREIDISFLLPMRGVGTFRTYSFRRELPPEWFESSFYQAFYGSVGTFDSLFIGFPFNEDAESHFGFYSSRMFTDEEIAVLTYALRGIKRFHRQLMLGHGLLMASSPLTPTERKVLQLLLTEASEKQISDQIAIAVSTVHSHVVCIFRKFGVRSRAGLMSLWLNRQA